jgi:hypothetical protein
MTRDLNDIQKQCESMGVLPAAELCGGFTHLAGLCPRCKQPIQISLTNGGKLSPSRTLDCRHIFSGNVRCEDPATNEKLAKLSGHEKADFFAMRRDLAILKDMTPEYRRETMKRLWPKWEEEPPSGGATVAPSCGQGQKAIPVG